MFLGHYAVGLAAKRAAPRVSLGVLFGAVQLADLVWPIFVLLGLERVQVAPNDNPFLVLTFVHYPWTHSLLAVVGWGVLAGGIYAAVTRNFPGALVVGALVVSHWVLDWIAHVPDLPLYPGSDRYGLGLWRSPAATMLVEAALFAAGLAVYVRATRPLDRAGQFGLWGLVVFLALIFVGNALGPLPPSDRAVAWTALAAWLIPLFAFWVDRHRGIGEIGVRVE